MFVNLHVHSSYSLLDGAIRIADLVIHVREAGMPAVAVTDHGTLAGWVRLALACQSQGIQPIYGVECYVDPRGIGNRQSNKAYHLVLLARNDTGLRHLIALNNHAWREGYYYKPRVDWELLSRYAEGLVCLSGCLKGELAQAFLAGREEDCWEILGFYRRTFGEYYFLELGTNSLEEQRRYNDFLLEISTRCSIPTVLTCDAHYLLPGHHQVHEVLLCIQTNAVLSSPSRFRFAVPDFYLHTPAEVYDPQRFSPALQDAARRTLEVSRLCQAELALGQDHLSRLGD